MKQANLHNCCPLFLLTILLVFTFIGAARAQKAIPNNKVLENMDSSCPAPTDFAVAENGITNHTATLQWTGYSDSYTVSYRTADDIVPVFSEGFENGIEGWTLRDCAGATGVPSSSDSPYAHSGNAAFRLYYNTTPPQYLISPEISEGTKLEFYYKNSSSKDPETFQVGFSTTDNGTSSFTFGEVVTASDTEWHLYSVTIPAGTKYCCIKHTSNYKYYLYIDDIVIGTTVAAGDWQTVTVVAFLLNGHKNLAC